jgi:hypothetical protein
MGYISIAILSIEGHFGEYHYSECRIFIAVLSVYMMNVVLANVVWLSAVAPQNLVNVLRVT